MPSQYTVKAWAVSLPSWKLFVNTQWTDDLLRENSKSEMHADINSSSRPLSCESSRALPLRLHSSLFSPLPQETSTSLELTAFIFPPILSTHPRGAPLSLRPYRWDPRSPWPPFPVTAPAGGSAFAGSAPAPRAPTPSLWAVDSSLLFTSHLKIFSLGFIWRSALHTKCCGTLCIKGGIGTNNAHKSIVLNLHDFR